MLVKVFEMTLFGTLMPPSPLARWGRVYTIILANEAGIVVAGQMLRFRGKGENK